MAGGLFLQSGGDCKPVSSLGEVGEFGLIERIRGRYRYQDEEVVVGIGDDCAVLRRGNILEVITTDCLVEGSHYKDNWLTMRDVGWKALAVNVSDIAAVGGTPKHALVTLFLPDSLTVKDVDELYDGLDECCRLTGVSIVGGDIVRTEGPFAISVTLAGSCERDEIVLRSGARPGDLLVVTGWLGEASIGLGYLESGKAGSLNQAAMRCIERFKRPMPRLPESRRLIGRLSPTAMIDLSDGLLSDLWHILEASGVGARLDADLIPIGQAVLDFYGSYEEALSKAISGGEDYELLFAIPPGLKGELEKVEQQINLKLTCIGEITKKPESVRLKKGDAEHSLERGGFDHFKKNVS